MNLSIFKRKEITLLIGSTIIITTTSFINLFNKKIDFPKNTFHHIMLVSLNRAVEDSLIKAKSLNLYLPYNKYSGGESILDSIGNLVSTKYVRKINLDANVQKEIHTCLKSPRRFGESGTDCLPTYRDAVVYCDINNKPIAWITFCFECGKIDFSSSSEQISQSSYPKLKSLFVKYGMLEK